MKISFILASLLALSATALHAEDFSRTLQTGASPHVSVSTGSGYVHIATGSSNEVRIVGHVHQHNSWGLGWGKVKDAVSRIIANPPVEQNGENIIIGRTTNQNRDLMKNVAIDYDITLPNHTSIEAHSGSGDIRASGIENDFAGYTGSGDIELNGAHGVVRLETGSGSIRAHSINGGSKLKTGSGDIELQQSGIGDVYAETGSGSIRLHGVEGSVRAETGSGDVEADGKATGDWRANTGSGAIRIGLGQSARFRVDASTGSGSIRIAQTGSHTDNEHHSISESINGGGPTLRLQTGSGDIQVH